MKKKLLACGLILSVLASFSGMGAAMYTIPQEAMQILDFYREADKQCDLIYSKLEVAEHIRERSEYSITQARDTFHVNDVYMVFPGIDDRRINSNDYMQYVNEKVSTIQSLYDEADAFRRQADWNVDNKHDLNSNVWDISRRVDKECRDLYSYINGVNVQVVLDVSPEASSDHGLYQGA